ncbi:hypothetical protein ACHWQZ_G018935 [Mnemiopsis leidyi]
MNGLLDPDSVITNLSDYVLSDVEKMALARGLDYTLPPTQLKKGGYLANFELLFGCLENKSFFGDNDEKLYFQNKLRNLAFSSLYNFNSSRHNLLNLPKEEMTALKQLSKNKDIIIFKPDKGTGIVIMNATDYIAKIEQIILDETKFSKHQNQDLYKISRSVERKVRNYLRDHLKKTGLISTETYRQLYPNGSRIGLLYGNPKVHKQGCPIRPICSAVGTATYDLSKYLAEIICPAATNSYGTDCRDSFQFLEQLQNYDLNNYFMACFDVSSLFTNVPLDETIGITLDRLYRSDVNTPPNLPEHVLKHLLEMCVKDNVFVFNGQVFYQTDGVAMGNPLGPILANIFMAHLEESMIFCGPNIVQPTFYRRYVDDTFCLFTTKEEAERFLVFINNLHPNIQFEMETESDGKLEFLDTVVERRPDSTSHRTSTKVKQTDKGIYYHYSSFIPDSYKLNKIFTLVYRAYRIASDMSVFHVDVEKLKKRLRLNGFPTHLIDQVTSKVLMRYHAQQDNQQDTQQPDRERVYIALPYLGPVSIILKRQLTKLVQKFYPSVQLKVVFRRGFRISNLFNYKDKFPIACRSMIVYYIQCKKCGPSQAYIGKTINSLYERFHASGTGHLHPNNIESALLKHCVESNDPECAFHFDDVKILESGRFDEEIRFIERFLNRMAVGKSFLDQYSVFCVFGSVVGCVVVPLITQSVESLIFSAIVISLTANRFSKKVVLEPSIKGENKEQKSIKCSKDREMNLSACKKKKKPPSNNLNGTQSALYHQLSPSELRRQYKEEVERREYEKLREMERKDEEKREKKLKKKEERLKRKNNEKKVQEGILEIS